MQRWRGGIFMFLISLVVSIPSYAQVRDLEWVDIISRAEWGATESWTWLDGSSWNNFRWFLTKYTDWLDAGGEDDDPGGKFAARRLKQAFEAARIDFLEEEYPQEIAIDETIEFVGIHELVRPWEYHQDKTKIVIHHTAGSQVYDTPEASLQGMKDIYEFHTLTRWRGDIGYNFLIDPYGTIYEGRAGGKSVAGGHTDWNNISTIGIALMGNFDRDIPTDAAREALVRLTTTLALEYDIDPYQRTNYFTAINEEPWLSVHGGDSLIGHQDAKNTGCPGAHMYQRLPGLKQQVAGLLNFIRQAWVSQWSNLHFLDSVSSVYIDDTQGDVSVFLPHGGKITCQSLDDSIVIKNCSWGTGDRGWDHYRS